MNVLRWLDEHFEETLIIVILVLISVVELAQVMFRNLPFVPSLTWAEEFCRFCWIWSVFLSLPYTIRKGSMLRVNVIFEFLSPRARGYVNIFADILTAGTMLFFGVYSVTVVKNILQSGETSPAMLLSMWAIYSVMIAGFFLAAFRGAQQIYFHIKEPERETQGAADAAMAEAIREADAVRGGKGA